MAEEPHIRIKTLPASTDPITDIEIRVNGSTVIGLGATAPGNYPVPSLTAGDTVEIRAVSASGAQPWADAPSILVPSPPATAPSAAGGLA